MKIKQAELLTRIDERVITIFNELTAIKKGQEEDSKKQYKCQTEIIPRILMEIKLLKARPLGITAFLATIFKTFLR